MRFQLAAAGVGVPLPRPVLGRDGRVLLAGGEAASGAAALRVYEWVDRAPERPPTGVELGTVHARGERQGEFGGGLRTRRATDMPGRSIFSP